MKTIFKKREKKNSLERKQFREIHEYERYHTAMCKETPNKQGNHRNVGEILVFRMRKLYRWLFKRIKRSVSSRQTNESIVRNNE